MVLGSIALYSLVPGFQGTKNFGLRTEVASFGIFVSAFTFLAATDKKVQLSLPMLAPIALVLGILAHGWSVPTGLRVIVGWGALALAINAMPSASRLFVRVFEISWLRQLGLYSFSLYLWQQPYYQLVRHEGMSPWLGAALAIATGIVAYYLVENPARVYLNQRWSTARASAGEEDLAETER